jgi:hypothetical protein
MFIGTVPRSLSVHFRAVSHHVSADQGGEVRLSEYAGRVIRNWYVVLIAVVVAVLLVVLHSVGTGKQAQAQATVFLGTPLTPIGGTAQLNTVVSNPTSATAFLHTESVLNEAAQKAGLKSGANLRNHLSVTQMQNSTSKTAGGTPNMQITVQGPYQKTAAITAVQSLGDSLIDWANRYQDAKSSLLEAQIATDKAQIANLQDALTKAQDELKSVGSSSMSATDRATTTAALLSTISDTGSRIDTISYQLTQNQIFQASARDVEAAGYVQTPSGGKVSAANHKSRLIVAVFAGLVVGVILALIWDAVRRRQRSSSGAAA